jgi:hypothetical protein
MPRVPMARRGLGLLAALTIALPAVAAEDEEEREERVSTLEKQVQVLAEELDSLRKSVVVPEEPDLVSQYGLGPAASKIYQRERGLSIGGYGEVRLRADVDPNDDQNVFDALRAVLYVGYKFNDWILVNSEIEFEHASTEDGGAVSTEFVSLDFLTHEALNFRAGLLLLPMGFINEIHEPVFYFGAARPEPERRIIPSTWRENGAGIFGSLGERVQYRVYVVNGFDATGFEADGLREGRQSGSEALSDHFAVVGRIDVDLLDGLEVGGSVYGGYSGQNQTVTRDVSGDGTITPDEIFPVPDTWTTIWEVHAQYQWRGLHLRGLWTQAHVDDSGGLSRALGLGANESVASRMVGGYAEVAYDVLPLVFPDTSMSLEPFFRFEHIDTQDRVDPGFVKDRSQSQDVYVVGAQFEPHPQVVIKLDYRNFDPASGSRPDEIQAGVGFVF